MCLDLSSPHDACQRRKIKGIEGNFNSLYKSKYIKVKDRSFAEGSRGCHALICLYAQPLSAKERCIAPYDGKLYYAVCRFYSSPSQVRTMLNFLLH